MPTYIDTTNLSPATIATLQGPVISQIQITDSSYVVLDDTAVSTSGGYIKITGSNFTAGTQVVIGTVAASSVSFINSTTLNVQVPAQSAGTYVVYVTTNTGSVAIMVNGLTYSGTPTWVTGSTLDPSQVGAAVSIQLSATGDAPVTYSLAAGSSLPPGLSLSSAGLISGTVTGVTSETTYNFTVNATDAEAQDSPRAFSITITANDQYFEYVTTLLSASTPTSTFVTDASTNAFAVTVNGDARPSNFGPYTTGYYSNYFDGTGDYLTIATTSALSLNASDFTIECWYYKTGTGDGGIFSQWSSGGQMAMEVLSTGRVYYLIWVGSNVYVTATSTTVVNNAWNHIALVRNGATITIYVNGVADANTYNIGSTAISWYQGALKSTIIGYWADSAHPLQGYISNFRYIVGTAVYTSNFTPPTTPLTAVANTQILTCQSNRLIDNSTNNFAITRNGDVRVDSFDPFLPNTNFAGRGSGYFDGSGDYLTHTAINLGSTFTIECWIYKTNVSSTYAIMLGDGSNNWFAANENSLIFTWGGSPRDFVGTFSLNTWNHIAIVANSGTVSTFINGVKSATTASGLTSWVQSIIGQFGGSTSYPYVGYISDLRVINGTALYTTNFTPPTAPLTAITNTQLLTLQNNQPNNNSMFLDSSTNNFNITRNGNTTQGTFSPYGGGWSNYFDGTGDYLTVADNAALQMDSGDFTIEFWWYPTSITSPIYQTPFDKGYTSTGALLLQTGNSDGRIVVYASGSVVITASTAVTVNAWNHMALVRNSTTLTLYLNGVSVGSATNSTNFNATNAVGIGANSSGGLGAGSYSINGYMSNMRVVKGTAVYTSAFTPPTAPLAPIANTSLLTCADNRFIDDSANNAAITRNGDVTVTRFNPFNPVITTPTSYGAYFDGTGDNLTVPASTELAPLTGDFTYECWAFPTSSTATYRVIFGIDNYGSGQPFRLYQNGTVFELWYTGSASISSSTIAVNAWHHLAFTRQSGTLRFFVNGVQQGSNVTSTVNYPSSVFRIGMDSAGTYPYIGYISNVRAIKGTAVYTTNFTPSTTPLTAIANTSLLTCQSATFVDNSTNNFTITANGDTTPRQFNPFGWTSTTGGSAAYTPALYGGSAYFDGTGDYLTVPYSSAFSTGTTYTIEAFVYPTVLNSLNFIFQVSNNNVASFGGWLLWINASGSIYFECRPSTGGTNVQVIGGTVPRNSWSHIAVSVNANAVKIYLNGVQVASGTVVAIDGTQSNVGIGALTNGASAAPWTGYISDVRLTKGTARYTSNFQPPIAPLTALQNTVLLNNMTGAGIYDSSMMANYETVGNASINTALKKYGAASLYFDGTTDCLFSPTSTNYGYGTGDFTIEFWLYLNATTQQTIVSNLATASSTAPHIYYQSGSGIRYYTASADRITGGSLATGQWYHIAVCRGSGTTRMFINGVQTGSSYPDANNYGTSNPLGVGDYGTTPSGASTLNGYIDDLRITRGVARYTGTFTPPASPVIRF